MLEELSISALGVIDDAVLDLQSGFTVVTGETGAGKTMVVTALGLLLGARADAGAVRQGARQARVEGRVRLSGRPDTADRALAAGAALDEDSLILTRTVTAQGRSRANAGGAGVPATVLASLAADLVVVHGQSDQQQLLVPSRQRDCLDAFGGSAHQASRDAQRQTYDRRMAVEAELVEVVTLRRERAQEADLLRWGIQEISAAGPQPGENIALQAEESTLGHVEALRQAARQARAALSSDELAVEPADALSLVARARKALDAERGHDDRLAQLADQLAAAAYLLADVAADISSYGESLETDPLRLAAVQDRRALLGGLLNKYGDTLDDVLAWQGRAEARLGELDDDDARVEALRTELDQLSTTLQSVGKTLTDGRRRYAAALGQQVTAELTSLAMPQARFEVQVSALSAPSRDGLDEVGFMLSAHQGAEPRPLQRSASGGELSRVMLALEVCLAGTQPVPTMIFDEVDAGVGGKAAVEVGRRLARLARSVQVIVVTHLPQVAAFADQHYAVVKSSDGSVTTSGVQALDDAGRRQELSRMLAGLEGSNAALAHADELVELAARERRA